MCAGKKLQKQCPAQMLLVQKHYSCVAEPLRSVFLKYVFLGTFSIFLQWQIE